MGLFKNWKQNLEDREAQVDMPEPIPTPAPKVERAKVERSYKPESLTDADRQDLAAIRNHPGFDVILKIMERECESFTTKLINADAADDKAIVAAHRMAKAAWQYFVHIQKQIEFEVNEAISGKESVETPEIPDLDDAQTIARLLDPMNIR